MSRGGRDDESREVADDERALPAPGSPGAGRGASSDNTTTDAPSPPPIDDRSSAREHTRTTVEADRDVDRSAARTPERSEPWSASRDLALPRTPDREPVTLGRDRYRLRGSEAELLATVGAFRVVPERNL